MAQLITGPFNALQYDPELGAPQLPLGKKQPMRITGEEVVASKNNSNSGYIAFNVEILDGPNKGSQGVYRLNVYNQSEKAAEMAMRQLSALTIACGKTSFQDTRELFNLPFLADVDPQPETEQNAGKGYTQITQVYDVNGNKPKRGGATGQDQSQQQNNNQQQQTNTNQGGNGSNWNTNGNNSNTAQGDNMQQNNGQNQTGNGNGNWNNNQGQDQQQNNNQQQQNNSGNGGGNGGGATPPWMQKQG